MSEICASCLEFDMNKIIKSKSSLSPKWLDEKDHVREYINKSSSFTNRYPEKYNVKMKLNVGKHHAGKKVLYWAAKEKKGNTNIYHFMLQPHDRIFKNSYNRIHELKKQLLKRIMSSFGDLDFRFQSSESGS